MVIPFMKETPKISIYIWFLNYSLLTSSLLSFLYDVVRLEVLKSLQEAILRRPALRPDLIFNQIPPRVRGKV